MSAYVNPRQSHCVLVTPKSYSALFGIKHAFCKCNPRLSCGKRAQYATQACSMHKAHINTHTVHL